MKKVLLLCLSVLMFSGSAFAQSLAPYSAIQYVIHNETGAPIKYFFAIDSRNLSPTSFDTSLPVGESRYTFKVIDRAPDYQSNIALVASLAFSSNKDSITIDSDVNGIPAENYCHGYGKLTATCNVITDINDPIYHVIATIKKK